MSLLTFAQADHLNPKRKTHTWIVRSGDGRDYLGRVEFWPHWRRYVFAPYADAVFDATCLIEVAAYCDAATADWKRG